MKEIYKDIPNYEGLYQVSNLCNVKSSKTGIRKPYLNNKGYYQLNLCKNGKKKLFKVHQLVAITFLNHKPNGHKIVVDHINGDTLNNRVNNLRLVSNRENTSICHRKLNGTFASKYVGVYYNKQRSKWCGQIYIDGKNRHLGMFDTEEEASEAYQKELKNIENNLGN